MKNKTIHTIIIKLTTTNNYRTDMLWARITHLIEMDKFFIKDGNFESIKITGKNNQE